MIVLMTALIILFPLAQLKWQIYIWDYHKNMINVIINVLIRRRNIRRHLVHKKGKSWIHLQTSLRIRKDCIFNEQTPYGRTLYKQGNFDV